MDLFDEADDPSTPGRRKKAKEAEEHLERGRAVAKTLPVVLRNQYSDYADEVLERRRRDALQRLWELESDSDRKHALAKESIECLKRYAVLIKKMTESNLAANLSGGAQNQPVVGA
jgi:geranylgeranyl pyrophosphate synthase